MKSIKFSHFYLKMRYPIDIHQPFTLLQVLEADRKDLSRKFVDYDTEYSGDGFQNYPLPKGALLVLLLEQNNAIMTTVRSRYGKGGRDKLSYYKSLEGQKVTVEIVKEAGKS